MKRALYPCFRCKALFCPKKTVHFPFTAFFSVWIADKLNMDNYRANRLKGEIAMKRIISMLLLTAMLLSLLPASAQAASSTNNSLFFDFTDDAAARNRYKATAYGNINYDVGGWNYDNERVSQILNDSGNGVLTMAVKKITRGEYYDKNGNYYSKSQVIDGYFQSSCSRSSCVWKRTKEHKYWLNKCGGPKNCTAGSMRNNPKGVSEGEITCSKCDMDYCGLCGYEKIVGSSRHLTQVFKTPESALTTVTNPYVQTSNLSGKATTGSLSYAPADADTVTIRFKLKNCTASGTPSVRLSYIKNNGTAFASDYMDKTFAASAASSNQFITVTMPASSGFRSASVINTLRITFMNVSGSTNSSISIDYLYIGKQADAQLLFDYTADAAANARYNTYSYAGQNYDTAGSWSCNASAVDSLSTTANSGALTLNLNSTGSEPAISTWAGFKNYRDRALHYNASSAEVMQLRLKMTDVVQTNNAPPTVSLSYSVPETLGWYRDVMSAAASVANHIEKNKSLPAKVSVGSYSVTMPQLAMLSAQVIVGLNAGKTEETLSVPSVAAAASPSESLTAGTVDKSNYITGANNFISYVKSNGKAPNYSTFSVGKVRFENTLYLFARVLRSYLRNWTLPSSASVTAWSSVAKSASIAQRTCDACEEADALPAETMREAAPAPTVRSVVAGAEVGAAELPAAMLSSGEYFYVNVPLNETFRTLTDVNSIAITFGNMKGGSNGGKIVIDYIYIGPKAQLPVSSSIVTFMYGTQMLATAASENGTVSYPNALPTTAPNQANHFVFAHWIDEDGTVVNLSDIRADMTVYADFAAAAHTPTVKNAKAATCGLPGYSGDTCCTECGYLISTGHTIPALGHIWDDGVISSEATCLGAGAKTYTCTVCGTAYTEATSSSGHTPGEAVRENELAATCIAEGSYDSVVYCANCHVQLSRETISVPAAGHTYAEEVVPAACYTGGYTIHTCTACGDSYTDTKTQPLGHDYVEETLLAATCTTDGKSRWACSRCGDTYETEIPAQGHDYQEEILIEVTCTGDGAALYTCSRCSDVYASVFSPLGHDYQETVLLAPTCTQDGASQFCCSRCNDSFSKTVPALDHDYQEEVLIPLTCTSDGASTFTCSRCNDSVTAILPEQGHFYVEEILIEPSCVGNGARLCTCAECGDSHAEVVEPTGHDYVENVLIPVSCISDGASQFVCSCCDDSYIIFKNATGHSYDAEGNGNGTHICTCSYCKDSYQESCTYENGACTICGEARAGEDDTRLRITSAFLRLDEDINVVYTAEVPEAATDVYMTFTMNDVTTTVEDDGSHRFVFEKVTPQCMGDRITAVLHATCEGKQCDDTVADYSVRQYCVNLLNQYPDDKALITLLSDLLTYGAAAQTYTDYQTEALVTENLPLQPSAFSPISGYRVTIDDDPSSSLEWKSATLVLQNQLTIRFCFAAAFTQNLEVGVTIGDRTKLFSAEDFVSDGGDRYHVDFTGIKATEFSETVTADFRLSGTQGGRMASYSVNTYICSMQNNEQYPNLAALVRALYNYGVSARAYTE